VSLPMRHICSAKHGTISFRYCQPVPGLLSKGLVDQLLITNSEPKSGYPGYASWEKELLHMGVPSASIAGVDHNDEACLNTLVEAVGMIAHAKRVHYARMYVVASPFHQLRAFMTSITAALRKFPEVKIYSYNGVSLPWTDTVTHSQGATVGSRKELLYGEFERIRKYQEKGDLALESDVLAYLDTRDEQLTGGNDGTAPGTD
jgi:hypothetical protein